MIPNKQTQQILFVLSSKSTILITADVQGLDGDGGIRRSGANTGSRGQGVCQSSSAQTCNARLQSNTADNSVSILALGPHVNATTPPRATAFDCR